MSFDAYVAGLVDGEGCIYLQRDKRHDTYYPVVAIAMTVRAKSVLDAVQGRYGGILYRTRRGTLKHAEVWGWKVYSASVTPLIMAISPHLRLKRQQAAIVLRVQEMIAALPMINGNKAWNQAARAQGHLAWHALKQLNRRGPVEDTEETVAPPVPSVKPFARLVGGCIVKAQRNLFTPTGWEEWSGSWPASGMLAHGVCWTPSTSAFPSVGDGCSACSLEQILESNVPSKYWLSPKACAGILRRAAKRGRKLPPLLETALRSVAQSPPDEEALTITTPAPAT